ncbi:MAG: WG repeat-containing protein [Microcoleaceae cyanobacterium]
MLSDIQNHWAQAYISLLEKAKIVKGYPDGSFRPDAPVSRAEFATLMIATFPEALVIRGAIAFKDVPTQHWASKDIRSATQKGFFAGYPDGTFRPNQPIPRVQVTIALAAFLKYPIPPQPGDLLKRYFDDAADIPNYAKPLTAAAVRGLIVNYPEVRRFHPNRGATRGEVSTFLGTALGFKELPQYVASERPDPQLFAIAPQFLAAETFEAGLALIKKESGGQCFINPSGQVGFPKTPGISLIGSQFSEGLIAVSHSQERTAGYLDRTEKTFIPLEFLRDQPYGDDFMGVHFGDFSEGMVRVTYLNKAGYTDKTGKWVIQPQFDHAGDFHQQRAWVDQPEIRDGYSIHKYGYIDPTGNVVIAPQFHKAGNFKQGLAWVSTFSDRGYGYINLTGELVIEPRFYEAGDFDQGIALVNFEGKWGYINLAGEWVMPPRFQEIGSFVNDLAPARLSYEDKWGYINRAGEWVIQPQFDSANNFSEGMALVSQNEKTRFIDPTGQTVFEVDPQISEVRPFSEGLAAVAFPQDYQPDQVQYKWGYLDRQGKLVIQPQAFFHAGSFSGGLAQVQLYDRWIREGVGCDGMGGPGEWIWVLTGGKWGYLSNPLKPKA